MLLTMESKAAARQKLEQLITRGRTSASEVVDYVMNHQPSDRLSRGEELAFEPDPESSALRIRYPDPLAGRISQRLYRHAVHQVDPNSPLATRGRQKRRAFSAANKNRFDKSSLIRSILTLSYLTVS